MGPGPVGIEHQTSSQPPLRSQSQRVVFRPSVPANVGYLAQLWNGPARRNAAGSGRGDVQNGRAVGVHGTGTDICEREHRARAKLALQAEVPDLVVFDAVV